MRLNLVENVRLQASAEEVWKLLRDTPRFAGLLPGVAGVKPLDQTGVEAYTAAVHDRIGPFKVTLHLELREARLLKASLKGGDAHNLNRVSGTLEAVLSEASGASGTGMLGTHMRFEASVEVWGKLATLGAAPMKRRTAELFTEFARNIQAQFAGETS